MRGNSIYRIALGVLFAVLTILPLPASAQTASSGGVNLTTSPLPINLSAIPGQTVSTELRVQNSSPKTQKIKVSLMKFKAYGEEGKPALMERQDGDDYFDWVTFNPVVFDAPPNEWMKVKMTINVPKTAAFGYYYAAVFTPADQKPTGKGNSYLGSTAVLVLLDVKSPNAKRSLEVEEFTADRKMYEFLPAVFSIKVHNNGNTHVQPTGNVFIKKGSKLVATLPVNIAKGNVLPGSNRIFKTAWADSFPVYVEKQKDGQAILKDGKPVRELQWDFTKVPHLKFGHYTANLLLVYDSGQQDVPLEASLSFWVIPWRVLFYAVAIPVIPAVLVYLIMRRRLNKKLATHKKKAGKE